MPRPKAPPVPRLSFWLTVVPAIAAVLAFLPAILNMGHLFARPDWNNYDTLSWIVRSSVFTYHRLPLHIPWLGGGLDLMQNPQNRLFSPMGMLDVLLAPQWANLTSLILYGIAGAIGMAWLLAIDFGTSPETAALVAVLFVGSSWFGLHFAEGHIPFGSLQLLPWIAFLARRFERRASQLTLAGLAAWMILDGGVYAFIFSLLIAPVFLKKPRAQDARFLAWLVLSFAVLSLAKLYPTLKALRHHPPNLEQTVMGLRLIATSLFDPIQRTHLPTAQTLPFFFHEFGCYVGVLGPLVIAWAAWRGALRGRGVIAAALGLFLWTATGIGGDFNPWTIFQHLPLIHNVHVQSRLLLLFFFCFLLLLAPALDCLRRTNFRIYLGVCLCLLAELTVTRVAALSSLGEGTVPTIAQSELIQSTTVLRTEHEAAFPELLREGNLASATYPEVSFIGPTVSWVGNPDYRGETYLIAPSRGTTHLERDTPGEIVLSYDTPTGTSAWIGLNTRALDGWRVESLGGVQGQGALGAPGPASLLKIRAQPNGLLGVEAPGGHGEIRLTYTPHHLPVTLGAFLLGLLMFAAALTRYRFGAHGGVPDSQSDCR